MTQAMWDKLDFWFGDVFFAILAVFLVYVAYKIIKDFIDVCKNTDFEEDEDEYEDEMEEKETA